MIRKSSQDTMRARGPGVYLNHELSAILTEIEMQTKDRVLTQSLYIGPTALTFIKRLIEQGGTIIADTQMLANEVNADLLGKNGAKVVCFIDDPQVRALAEQRQITRAEIAVDYALAIPGPKLMLIGSAPAAINRIIARRKREPMSDVCVLAAPNGFASVVQMKEKLMDSSITSIVVRGKKGGINVTSIVLNAILRQCTNAQLLKPAPDPDIFY